MAQVHCLATPFTSTSPRANYAKQPNHRKWVDSLLAPADPEDLPCACKHLRTLLQHADHPTTDGQLQSTRFNLPPHLRIFLDANMNSTFYPYQSQILPHLPDGIPQVAPHSRLPTIPCAAHEPFLHQQWQHRIHSLKHHPRFTARLVRQLQEYLGDKVVLHRPDHELQQIRIFCPQKNFFGALTTWRAPELFQPMPHLTPRNIQEHLLATIPPGLRTRYKWGLRKEFTIP